MCQSGDAFEHAGSILVNISKSEAGRKLLLDPKRGLLKQILRQFDSTSVLRKKGVCISSVKRPIILYFKFSNIKAFWISLFNDKVGVT